jgi:glycosyltransferase involved in cell wall biosynthesis
MTDKLRVVMLVLNQVGKGTYWRVNYLSRHLARRGHAVTAIFMSRAEHLHLSVSEVDGVQVVESPDLFSGALRSGWDPWDTARRMAWLRGRSFDIVHAVECRPVVVFPALQAQRRGARLVMDWSDWFGRGGSVEERPSRVMRTVLRPVETFFEEHFRTRADGTVTINAFLRDRAISLGVPLASTAVIRNGCDTAICPPDRLLSRRALGLPEDAPLIGYVGNIYTGDARFMAEAFNCVHRVLPSARLVLVGYFNRHIEPWLEDPAAVIRSGPLAIEQVYAYLGACDLCWLPLRNSGANRGRWPGKLNDYMSLARPVVSTAVGDLGDLVTRYRLGLVAPDEPEPFAAQTVRLLADRELAVELGRAARAAAEAVFSWEQRAADLEAFYGQVLAMPASQH